MPASATRCKRTESIVESALQSRPEQRLALVDQILKSLDQPDPEIDRIWIEEADRRGTAYRAGKVTHKD